MAFCTLLAFVESEVARLNHASIRVGHALPAGHCLEKAFRAAERLELCAIKAYETVRVVRVKERIDGIVEERLNGRRADGAKPSFTTIRHRLISAARVD